MNPVRPYQRGSAERSNGMKILNYFFLVFFMTSAAFLHTHQRIEAMRMSYEIKEKRASLNKLLDQKKELEYNVARLKAPTYLEFQLAKEDVKLVQAEHWQVFDATSVREENIDSSLPLFVRNIVDRIFLNREAQATPAAK